MSDLQLTVDTLKTSLRDAQRTVAELRAEVDARRQELADLQVGRAQLEGYIREAERRLTEARHVIDLQREELSNSRSQRERMKRARATLQDQLKQLQKQVSKVGKQARGNVSPATTITPPRDGQLASEANDLQQETLLAVFEEGILLQGLATKMSGASSVGDAQVISQPATVSPRAHVLVKSGDTLWRIARRHHTSVRHLMVYNALLSDRIQVGQTLRLTDPPTDELEHERM